MNLRIKRLRWLALVSVLALAIPLLMTGSGYRTNYVVLCESMNPVFHPGDLVITNPMVDEVAIGDIVVFQSPLGGFLIHRVVDVVEQDGTTFFVTKGDANTHVDSFLIPQHSIIGKLFLVIPHVGSLFLIPKGIVLVCNLGLVAAYVMLTFTLPASETDTTTPKRRARPLKPLQAALIACLLLIPFVAQSSVILVYPTDTKNVTTATPLVVLDEGTQGTCMITDDINANCSVTLSHVFVDDFVDVNTTNVDGSPNVGTHANFTAQQVGPDALCDVLTEKSATTGYDEFLWITGNDDDIQKLNKTDPGALALQTNNTGLAYPFGCEYRLEDGNEYIYIVSYFGAVADRDKLIKFHAENMSEAMRWDISSYSDNAYGLAWNGSRWFIVDGGQQKGIYQVDPADPTTAERSFSYTGLDAPHGCAWDGSYLWVTDYGTQTVYQIDLYGAIQTSWSYLNSFPSDIAYDAMTGHLWITDSSTNYLYEYETNGTEINWWDPTGSMPHGLSYAATGNPENYQLDVEVQFTTVDYDYSNEDLCIYGGAMDAENILVDVWNGTTWANLFQDLGTGWNNISISSYLTTSTLTIRFRGGTETSDGVQDSWSIDATFLHLYELTGDYDYVLQVNNTDTNFFHIRLKKYNDVNLSRLLNGMIYFYNGSGTSNQLLIQDGAYIQDTGAWSILPPSSVVYIAASVSANSTGTSRIDAYLEIKTPNQGVTTTCTITFEIT